MSVIIRLQNLPWSANAMDIRTFFRGLSIPEGGVHIVGGEQGDAFIAFSTDEDARQAMMNDGGRIKEVQVKLLLSSRSEMHKVIESARQSVSFMQLASQPALPAQPIVTQPPSLPAALSGLLAQNIKHMGLPPSLPLANLMEAVPKPDPQAIDDRDSKRNRDVVKGNDRKQRSRSSSRDRSKKDRGRDKKDKRDRSRSRDRSRERERRRRDRSRSRERRDRKRDRKDRSRDRERSKEKSESRSSFRNDEKKKDIEVNVVPPMLQNSTEFMLKSKAGPILGIRPPGPIMTPSDPRRQFGARGPIQAIPNMQQPRQPYMNQGMNIPRMGWSQEVPVINPQVQMPGQHAPRVPLLENNALVNMYNQHTHPPKVNNSEELHRLQELGERRNPNAFQNTEPTQNHSPPQDPRQRLNVYNDMNFQKNNNSRPPQNYNDDHEQPFLDSRKCFMNKGVCVKITNLPLHTGYGDIRRFFVGHYISGQGLKMINDDNGRRTGIAYIKFFKPESKIEALRKSGKNLKGEFVTVTHLEEEEFENAIDAFQPGNAGKGEDSIESGDDDAASQKSLVIVEHEEKGEQPFKVLFLEDLPPFAKEHDIMKMFSDYSLLSITLIATKDFRKQYIAYVQFVNADDAKAALNNKAKHLIGHKSIIVSPCSETAYEQAKMAQNNAIDNIQDSNDADLEPEPPMEEEPAPQSRDPRQRRFENRMDVGAPFNNPGPYLAPGMQNINPRFQWRPTNPTNLPPGDGRPPMARGMPPMIPNDFDRNKRFNDVRLDCVFIKGLPLRTTDRDILDFFSDVGVIPTKIHLMLTVQGEPSGDCFCEFVEPEEAASAATKNGKILGTNTINIEPVPKSVVDEALGIIPPENKHFGPPMRGFRGGRGFIPRGRGRGMRGGRDFSGRGGSRFSGPPSNMHSKDNNQGPDGFGNPGCVLSLENVPFRSGIDEILEFFSGFNIAQSDVIRRFNENGHPTGDARVSFRSPFEAQRAMKQLNMQCIRGRPINVRLL